MTNTENIYYLFCDGKCPQVFLNNNQNLRLAEYLNANNVVALPCKVGDTVYIVNETFKHSNKIVLKCQVNEFVIDSNGPAAVLDCVEMFLTKRRYTARPISDFGRVIFLDKAAAEQAAGKTKIENADREQYKPYRRP